MAPCHLAYACNFSGVAPEGAVAGLLTVVMLIMLGCVGNPKGRAVMRDRESWLAATMIEVADTSAVEFDEAAHVHGFAGRLAELLTPAEVAVLMPARPGHLGVATGSSERALDLARLEASGMAGP